MTKSEKRNSAYMAFRSFYKDSNQSGDTLSMVSPVKFKATRSLITRRTTLLREAFRPDAKVMATSLLVPSELAWALDCIPLNLEMFSSLLASHSKILELTNKGSLTAPRCSFINSVKGAMMENLVPMPDILLSSTAYCEGIGLSFEDFKNYFDTAHFHIDIPSYSEANTSQLLASDLKQMLIEMAGVLDLDSNETLERFRQVMYNSIKAKAVYQKIWELRKKTGPLNLGLEPLHWHMQFLPMWGDDRAYTICEKLYNEISHYIESTPEEEFSKGTPVGMFGLIPYGRTDIWRQLRDADLYTSFEGVNYLGEINLPDLDHFDQIETDTLFEFLAETLIKTPVRGGEIKEKSNDFMAEASSMHAKGMIIVSQEHCQLLAPRLHELETAAGANGMKVVSLGGDCILGMPKGPTTFRLNTFIDSLTDRSKKAAKFNHDISELKIVTDYRLGVDFGSGFSKFVLVDKQGVIAKQGVVASGIDYPGLLDNIKSSITINDAYKMAISGVGSDNTTLKGKVDVQTTELNALIASCRNLFSYKEQLLVIDIGTQDVKVLHFHDMDAAPWINTNKSCGAGTGMVLTQILERWRHSHPEYSFDTLDNLAYEASEGEMINTTCGIFAITNVVSALVQADEERRKSILWGLYQYIASQAIKLLPDFLQNGGEVFLTGGIARHKSLQKVFKERGFELVKPQMEIHPQYLVAYGTALSTR